MRRRSKYCVALKRNRQGLAGADYGRLMVGCGSLIPSALPTLSGMFSGWFCPGDDCAWSWAEFKQHRFGTCQLTWGGRAAAAPLALLINGLHFLQLALQELDPFPSKFH